MGQDSVRRKPLSTAAQPTAAQPAVTGIGELEAALKAAEAGGKCFFIEVQMDRMDAPEALKTLGAIYARQDYA
jgi:TPP-dependent 2-oxoacid decarboxylase